MTWLDTLPTYAEWRIIKATTRWRQSLERQRELDDDTTAWLEAVKRDSLTDPFEHQEDTPWPTIPRPTRTP